MKTQGTAMTSAAPQTMMNFMQEVAHKNQIELSDLLTQSFYYDPLGQKLGPTTYSPNVDIVHRNVKTNKWSNSKSKRLDFLPIWNAENPGPGHYNQQQLTMTNKQIKNLLQKEGQQADNY